MLDTNTVNINTTVCNNYARLRPNLLILPIIAIAAVVAFLLLNGALSAEGYAELQRGVFISINSVLSQYPSLQYNITQLGNSMIIMSLIAIFIRYAPNMWSALVAGSIASGILSKISKMILCVPRPVQYFGSDSFNIIGEPIWGYASCPSGHSITVFTVLTVLLFAFLPQSRSKRVLWGLLLLSVGTLIVLSRIGVGAHYPLDIIVGAIIGYISGILGILFDRRFPAVFGWIGKRKYLPILILLLVGTAIAIILKITHNGLIIFYISLISIIISIYAITKEYIGKNK